VTPLHLGSCLDHYRIDLRSSPGSGTGIRLTGNGARTIQ